MRDRLLASVILPGKVTAIIVGYISGAYIHTFAHFIGEDDSE